MDIIVTRQKIIDYKDKTFVLLFPIDSDKDNEYFEIPGDIIEFGETPEGACLRCLKNDYNIIGDNP